MDKLRVQITTDDTGEPVKAFIIDHPHYIIETTNWPGMDSMLDIAIRELRPTQLEEIFKEDYIGALWNE